MWQGGESSVNIYKKERGQEGPLKSSLVLVEEPEQGDGGAANDEEEELSVPVLIIGELVDEDLRAGDVNESAARDTKHNRTDEDWRILDPHADGNTGGLNQRETEENEEYGLFRLSLVLPERDPKGDACG